MIIKYKNSKFFKSKSAFQHGGKRLKKNIKFKSPSFSIVTTVKNNKSKLEKTINSLIRQKNKDFEHIIIDAGSTDGSLELIKKYENRVDYWVSRNDQGIYNGFNDGIKLARGDVIGIINSGDLYTKNALKIISKYFKKKKLDFIFGTVKKDEIKYKYDEKKIKWSFNFYPAHSSGFFIKNNAQKKLGLYDTKFKCSADYDLFMKMILKKKMRGTVTKKTELIGRYEMGGFSQKITMIEHIIEEGRIRINNKQNIIYVLVLSFLRIIRNFYQLGLIKFIK